MDAYGSGEAVIFELWWWPIIGQKLGQNAILLYPNTLNAKIVKNLQSLCMHKTTAWDTVFKKGDACKVV